MELLNHLSIGFSVALTAVNLMYAFIGVLLGTLIGVLPGIGPVATIAMLLPTTYALQPVSALIMLAGIYYGAQYGGSTTSILINMPGETSSAVTCLDGYQMARKGEAGAALSIAAIGSFFAGCVATVLVAAVSVPLSELALKFGPAEYFSLMTLGLIGATVLAHGSLVKAIAMVILGLLLGIVGTDVNSGVARFDFGIPELSDGIGVVSVAMGLFGFAEIILNLESVEKRELLTSKIKGFWLTKKQMRAAAPAVLRGTGIGSVLGILPGLVGVMQATEVIKLILGKGEPLIGRNADRSTARVSGRRRGIRHGAAGRGRFDDSGLSRPTRIASAGQYFRKSLSSSLRILRTKVSHADGIQRLGVAPNFECMLERFDRSAVITGLYERFPFYRPRQAVIGIEFCGGSGLRNRIVGLAGV